MCSVYDLTPERIGGPVDFAFVGALLLHLRDPVAALERVRSALVPGGDVVLCEPVSRRLGAFLGQRPVAVFQASETDFNWWLPERLVSEAISRLPASATCAWPARTSSRRAGRR